MGERGACAHNTRGPKTNKYSPKKYSPRATDEISGLALFDLLFRENISKADRERLKQASKSLLAALQARIASMPNWTKNTQTQADVKVLILDAIWQSLPRPPYSEEDVEVLAGRIYDHVWGRSESGAFAALAG